MNEFYVNMDSSGDELINRTFNLLEDSQDTVNMAPVNVVYSGAYDNNFDRHIFEGASNLSTLQDDKDILTFMEKQQNKSTLYKDKTDMNKFTKYLSSIGIHKLPEFLMKQELDNALCKFYINVTRNDEALPEPDTLTSYKNSIARYLESKNSHDIKKDPDFVRSRVVLKKRRAELTRMGKGNKPNACRALENEEMDVLFNETDTFGVRNPEQLQRTIWWKIACHFGHRARDESRKLEWGDIQKVYDKVSGRQMLVWNVERGSKTRNGAPMGHLRSFYPKALETGGPRCPVMVYNEFEKHRPQSMLTADAPFFLRYKTHWKPSDDVWYTDRPLGKNKIGEFLSKCPAVQDQKLISSGKKSPIIQSIRLRLPASSMLILLRYLSLNLHDTKDWSP